MAIYKTAANIPFGSRTLNINNVVYIAPSFSIQEPTTLVERTDELGNPNGAVQIDRARTGTATLQLATNTTAYPTRGLEFVSLTSNTNVNYFLTEVTQPEEAEGIKTVSISFREKI